MTRCKSSCRGNLHSFSASKEWVVYCLWVYSCVFFAEFHCCSCSLCLRCDGESIIWGKWEIRADILLLFSFSVLGALIFVSRCTRIALQLHCIKPKVLSYWRKRNVRRCTVTRNKATCGGITLEFIKMIIKWINRKIHDEVKKKKSFKRESSKLLVNRQ